jgi:hypothetical protein
VEPKCDRVFVDPNRGTAWRVAIGVDLEGRFLPVFRREGVQLWGREEPETGINMLSETSLRGLWGASHREIWCNDERWRVRWQERPNQETWTRFESALGARRVIKERYPFPFVSGLELVDALRRAERAG